MDGKLAAVCPECGKWTTEFVADHVQPVALGGSELGELRVHCVQCSRRQGGRVSNQARQWGHRESS